MNKIKNSYHLLSRLSDGFVPLVMLAITIPILVLAGFGIADLVTNGQWVLFFALIASSCLIIFVPYWWMRRSRTVETAIKQDLEGLDVEGNPAWTAKDQQIWQQVNETIVRQINEEPEWDNLKAHALLVLTQVAASYNQKSGKALSFTAPEFLLMTEEVSRRYRRFLRENIPFVDKVSITTLQQGYDLSDKLGYAKSAYDIYRLFRITTPTGWLAEARGMVLGQLFDNVSAEIQFKLKATLLQEVASVAIDLYSGQFKLADDELPPSEIEAKDSKAHAAKVSPLRVAVVGQVSAGKSSLVNALIGEMAAEVSALPSTDQVTVHQCTVDGIDLVHLIDLPGLDGDKVTQKKIVSQITNSDLVLWVLKANQSARKLDVELRQAVDEFYQLAANQNRKAPKILVLVNQVDRLPPLDEWQPPYDLSNPQTQKGKVIAQAVEFNKEKLNPDIILPLCVSQDVPQFNVDTLQQAIVSAYEDGVNTQLNRRRVEGDRLDLTEEAKRLYHLGEVLFKAYRKQL
ncbi:GTPase family protein [Photobacterium damselae]|uniref:GTPase family protein n=1 Tax=Photobacterium damselae TaxID=38293 RepID=UPI00083A4CBA|nr:GTPase [Photobacterium damselae]ODA26411.1 GTPase [Photobacterium damselae subsp. damselae]TLS72190.1 GTPase [Photobacterium damselae subsp. damselae]